MIRYDALVPLFQRLVSLFSFGCSWITLGKYIKKSVDSGLWSQTIHNSLGLLRQSPTNRESPNSENMAPHSSGDIKAETEMITTLAPLKTLGKILSCWFLTSWGCNQSGIPPWFAAVLTPIPAGLHGSHLYLSVQSPFSKTDRQTMGLRFTLS